VIDCDFSRLSAAQRAALADIAFGGDGAGHALRTLESLERRGLLASLERRELTSLGIFRSKRWYMPVAAHHEFCAWLALLEEMP
jgi:hypothetical protein